MIDEKPDGEKPRLPDGCILGRWEWVALPSFGVAFMKAILSIDSKRSTLACDELQDVGVDGVPSLRFRVFPLADDPRTFVIAEAPRASQSDESAEKAVPSIRTCLTLGKWTLSVELDLVPRSGHSQPLTLGRTAIGNVVVSPGGAALAGLPGCGRDAPELGSSEEGGEGS